MFLYRITRRERTTGTGRSIWVRMTRFTTSLDSAVKIAKTLGPGVIDISRCHVASDLKSFDWIDLLEADAPGGQEINRTPVDFITSEKHVKTITVKP